MSVRVGVLLGWNPAALDDAADDVEGTRRRVESAVGDLERVIAQLGQAGEGDAATAAAASLRRRRDEGVRIAETLSMVRRVLRQACDALGAARTQLVDAHAYARRYGLFMQDDGRVSRPPVNLSPAGDDAAALEAAREHQRLRDAAEQAQAMAFAALAAAAEADQDAARALRQAWAAAADGSTNDAPDRELVTAVGARDLPATGASPAEVSAWWASLSAAARALALRLHPDVIGNLDGIPFDVRVAANRANITNALADTRASITDLERRLAQAQAAFDQMLASGTPDAARGAELSGEIARLDRELADARAHAEMYDRLLTEETIRFDENGEDTVGVGHQVVLFDPAQGAFAEIVGNLDANTRNIAVMVPGTGANLLNMTGPVDSAYKRCADFALADGVQPPGSLAVISWMGGPLPQHLILESPQARFAVDLGPKLAQFTDGLTNPNGVPVTVVGHSYGGSVVGAAEAAGMHVDRVLHVESAGAGPGVGGVDEYASTGTARYSMTAPGDIIGYTQGREMLDIGHGADPDQLSGVTRLETGLWEDGKPSSGLLQGKDSHSDVFTPGSTAFNNMVGVMTGGEVSLYVDPFEYLDATNATGGTTFPHPMTAPGYSPPTMDVL